MKVPEIKNNERCGACGSRKTFILGDDKRIGKTCGNEDCKLHLSLIEWPPTSPQGSLSEAKGPDPKSSPQGVQGGRECWVVWDNRRNKAILIVDQKPDPDFLQPGMEGLLMAEAPVSPSLEAPKASEAPKYATTTQEWEARLNARFLEGIHDVLIWSGCYTGDCPHHQQEECDAAILEVGRQVAVEFLQDATLPPSPVQGGADIAAKLQKVSTRMVICEGVIREAQSVLSKAGLASPFDRYPIKQHAKDCWTHRPGHGCTCGFIKQFTIPREAPVEEKGPTDAG